MMTIAYKDTRPGGARPPPPDFPAITNFLTSERSLRSGWPRPLRYRQSGPSRTVAPGTCPVGHTSPNRRASGRPGLQGGPRELAGTQGQRSPQLSFFF